jgi:hypothetical protein
VIAAALLACAATSDPVDRPEPDPAETCDPYAGGWPCNPDKDALGEPPWDGVADEGLQVPRFVGEDQFGEPVDLYDLAGHGVPAVLDVSAGWCDPCQALARWLEGEDVDGFDPAWDPIRDAVAAGDLLWVTVLFEDAANQPATGAFSADWSAEFPNDAVPVLADPDKQLTDWLFPAAYPNVHLLSDAMVLEVYDPFGFDRTFAALADTQ